MSMDYERTRHCSFANLEKRNVSREAPMVTSSVAIPPASDARGARENQIDLIAKSEQFQAGAGQVRSAVSSEVALRGCGGSTPYTQPGDRACNLEKRTWTESLRRVGSGASTWRGSWWSASPPAPPPEAPMSKPSFVPTMAMTAATRPPAPAARIEIRGRAGPRDSL